MTQCWPEGALRAYLDGELPAEDMQRVAAHLGDCTVCDGLCRELAARAAHVSALMELLPEWGAAMPIPASPARAPHRRANWIAIAVALAACLALAAYLLPDRHPREAVVRPAPAPAPTPPPVAVTVAAVTPALAEQPAQRRPRRVRPTAPEPAYFVALDDEPFESGVIMRVGVKPGNVQADIVFGPDGRAHAFRLVNATQRNF
jgi:anti-sigma factor RsiW